MAPILESPPDDSWYFPPIFENTDVILRSHESFRFGQGNDFQSLFSENEDERTNYILGICGVSITFLCIFVSWAILLLALKIKGKAYGWAAGVVPTPPIEFYYFINQSDDRVNTQQRIMNSQTQPQTQTQPAVNRVPGQRRQRSARSTGSSIFLPGSVKHFSRSNFRYSNDDNSINSRRSFVTTLSTVELNETEKLLLSHVESIEQLKPKKKSSWWFFSLDASTRQRDKNINADKNKTDDRSTDSSLEEGKKRISSRKITNRTDGANELSKTYSSNNSSKYTKNIKSNNQEKKMNSIEENNQNSNNTENEWTKEIQRIASQVYTIRVIFILCACGVIVSSAYFMENGITYFQQSLSSIRTSLTLMDGILDQGIEATEEYINVQYTVGRNVGQFYSKVLSNWCPSQDPPPFENEINQMSDTIDDLGDLLVTDMISLNGDLYEIKASLEQVDYDFESYSLMLLISMGSAVFIVSIASVLIGGVILAIANRTSRGFILTQTYFILPIFIIVVFLCWCFASGFAASMLILGDFCFNSPDSSMMRIVDAYIGPKLAPSIYNLVKFYIEGCQTPIIANFVQYHKLIIIMMEQLHNFLDILSPNNASLNENIEESCGIKISDIQELATLLDSSLHSLIGVLFKLQEVFVCSNFNALYVSIAYDGLCYTGLTGIEKIYITSLTTALLGMVLVTLRVAWCPIGFNFNDQPEQMQPQFQLSQQQNRHIQQIDQQVQPPPPQQQQQPKQKMIIFQQLSQLSSIFGSSSRL